LPAGASQILGEFSDLSGFKGLSPIKRNFKLKWVGI